MKIGLILVTALVLIFTSNILAQNTVGASHTAPGWLGWVGGAFMALIAIPVLAAFIAEIRRP